MKAGGVWALVQVNVTSLLTADDSTIYMLSPALHLRDPSHADREILLWSQNALPVMF